MSKRLTQRDCSVSLIVHSGAWEVSAIVDNHLVTRTYYQYTKREAVRLFVQEAK